MRYREFGGKKASAIALGSTDFGGSIEKGVAMEYIDGETLKEYMRRNPQGLAPKEAMQIIAEVLQALSPVHAAGLLHRDISADHEASVVNAVGIILHAVVANQLARKIKDKIGIMTAKDANRSSDG